MAKFNSLFQPLEVRRCTIPNRIVMTPMGTNFAENTGENEFFAHLIIMNKEHKVELVLSLLKTRVLTIQQDQMEQHSCVWI